MAYFEVVVLPQGGREERFKYGSVKLEELVPGEFGVLIFEFNNPKDAPPKVQNESIGLAEATAAFVVSEGDPLRGDVAHARGLAEELVAEVLSFALIPYALRASAFETAGR